jgi:hypothetical protein
MGDLDIIGCKMCRQSLCLKHAMICECGIYNTSTDLLAIEEEGRKDVRTRYLRRYRPSHHVGQEVASSRRQGKEVVEAIQIGFIVVVRCVWKRKFVFQVGSLSFREKRKNLA